MPARYIDFDREKGIHASVWSRCSERLRLSTGSFPRARGAAAGTTVRRRGTFRRESAGAALVSVGAPAKIRRLAVDAVLR
jgi:hypothetical protein